MDPAILQGQEVGLLRESCMYFAHTVLRGPQEAPYNGRFMVSAHHEEWDELLHGHRRICVMAPRDHSKSFTFTFAFPLWQCAFNPGSRGFIFSATQDQAVRILRDIKDELEDNPKLAWLVPAEKEQWNATSIKLSNGARIYARGYGTKIRGAHPDWIVVDDGLNDEDAYSELVRTKNIDYFFTAISNMIVPGGRIIVVGTPFHGSDLYSALAQNSEYTFRRYPALSQAGEPLWPARYSVALLAAKRREIGSVRFTREFLCQPVSDDMSLFPEALFRGPPVEQFQARLGMPASYWNEMGVTRRYVGVDLAISSTTGADFTVLFVLGLDQQGNRWVVDIIREQGLPFRQQLSLINAVGRKYRPELIYIESNQMQRVFGDELIAETDLPIKKFITTGVGRGTSGNRKLPTGNTTTQNKNSLEGGVPALRVLLENRKFRIPRGDQASVAATEVWVQEMRSFTWLNGKLQGVGSHDDTVMACWIADQAVRDGGFTFSTGTEEGPVNLDALLKEQMGTEEEDGEEAEVVGDPVLEARLRLGDDGREPDDDLGPDDDLALDPVQSAWANLPGLRRGS